MNYHISTTINSTMGESIVRLTEELKKEGFGVLFDINLEGIFKEKIDVDFRPYRVIGTCNPRIGHKVFGIDEHMGVFLPCHISVQDKGNGNIKISAIDPIAPMSAVGIDALEPIGKEVQEVLKNVIERM